MIASVVKSSACPYDCVRRDKEKQWNVFPNYTMDVEHQGHKYTMHFLALFSEKEDAVPIVMLHGWPGMSFNESSTQGVIFLL